MPRLSLSAKDEKKRRLARNIKKYSIDCEITQTELAAKIGMSQPTLSQRMKNPGRFEFSEIVDIANVLNVTVETLVGKEALS